MLFKQTLAAELNRHLDGLRNPLFLAAGEGERLSAGLVKDLNKLGAFKGLNERQQGQLVSLIVAAWQVEQVVPSTAMHRRDRARWRRHGAGYLRKIIRLARTADDALTALDEYLKAIGVGRRARALFASARGALDRQSLVEVEDRLENGWIYHSTRTRTDVIRILHRFFKNTCGLERSEAEVRVATIGNEYWEWNFPVVENVIRRRVPGTNRTLSEDKRRGCEAVRKAVNRGTRTVDTRRTNR